MTQQDFFLASNFKLCSKGGSSPSARKLKESQRPKASSYENFTSIALSSPLGSYILTSSKLGLDGQNPASKGFKSAEEYVGEVEKRCPGTLRAFKSSNAAYYASKKKWLSTFEGSRKKSSPWAHLYCFTPDQMEKRAKELGFGLPAEAMRKANVKVVDQHSSGEDEVEADGVNPEDDGVVEQQGDVDNNPGAFTHEIEEMPAAGTSLDIEHSF